MLRFGENIKKLRKDKGLKLHDMPKKIGIKPTTWGGYERNESHPKLLDLIKICEFFDISETDLIHGNLDNESFQLNKPPQNHGENWEKKYYKKVEESELTYKKLSKCQAECLLLIKKYETVKNIDIQLSEKKE